MSRVLLLMIIINCSYSDEDEIYARNEVSCNLWPQDHLRTSVANIPPTTSATTFITTTETANKWVNPPGDLRVTFNSSTRIAARQCVAYITVAILFALFIL